MLFRSHDAETGRPCDVFGNRGQARDRSVNAHSARQIALAAIAEVVARATGFGIERQQACVQRAGEHPPPARTGLPGLAALPDTDAAGTDFGVAPGAIDARIEAPARSEEHTSELQSQSNLVCRLLLEKKKNKT